MFHRILCVIYISYISPKHFICYIFLSAFHFLYFPLSIWYVMYWSQQFICYMFLSAFNIIYFPLRMSYVICFSQHFLSYAPHFIRYIFFSPYSTCFPPPIHGLHRPLHSCGSYQYPLPRLSLPVVIASVISSPQTSTGH